jgi:Helix-turn-helix domain
MEKKKATEAAQNTILNLNDNSGASQRARVISALRTDPKTTLELRADWGVLMPAARVFELNERGWQISKITVKATTLDGVEHSGIARYFIVKEPSAANDATFDGNEGGAP